MIEKMEKKKLAILRILREAEKPVGSSDITEQLQVMGYEVSERTVRFYLLGMDRLNPVAILEEQGIKVHSRALAGLVDYKRLFNYKELSDRI